MWKSKVQPGGVKTNDMLQDEGGKNRTYKGRVEERGRNIKRGMGGWEKIESCLAHGGSV